MLLRNSIASYLLCIFNLSVEIRLLREAQIRHTHTHESTYVTNADVTQIPGSINNSAPFLSLPPTVICVYVICLSNEPHRQAALALLVCVCVFLCEENYR